MRSLIVVLCFLLTGAQNARPVHTHGMDLPFAERKELERKAASGDAAAAWQLFQHYSFERHDYDAGDPWLRRAAELDHAQAQRTLALLIRTAKFSPRGLGAAAPAAVKNLLERSARTE